MSFTQIVCNLSLCVLSAGEQMWGKQSCSCVSLQIAAHNSPVIPLVFAIPLIPLLVAALLRSRARLALVNAPCIGWAPLFTNVLQLHSALYSRHPHWREQTSSGISNHVVTRCRCMFSTSGLFLEPSTAFFRTLHPSH